MNIQVQVCGLLIMLLLYVFYRSSNTLKLYTEKIFHQSMCVSILCLSLDILSIVGIHNMDVLPLFLVESICKIYIITLIWVAMYAFVYVLTDLYSEERHRLWTQNIRVIILIQSLIVYGLPISIFKEESVVYTYGPAVLCVYGFVTIYILGTLGIIAFRFKELNKRRVLSVGLWMLAYISAAIIQFFNNQLLLVGFASAIGVLILFVFMENPEANLDRRIGCFNSYALIEYLKKMYERNTSFCAIEISFKDVDYLEDQGVHIEHVLRSIVDVTGRYSKLKIFKNINSNIVIVSKDVLSLQLKGEQILNHVADDELLRKNIRILFLQEGLRFGSASEMMHFFTFLRHTYANDIEGILIADDKMISQYMEKYIVEDKIAHALEEDRVEVFFQPIVRDSNDEKPYAAEALLRYTLPNGERISPMEFIPLLEESGLIIPVGKWVLKKAMTFCQRVQEVLPEFSVNVNVSYVQVLKSPFIVEFFKMMKDYGMSPSSITIELTESGELDDSMQIQKVWNNLRQFGVTIALDDFGTGYSNLMNISDMNPNVVKLDRGFTVKALKNDFEKTLMESIIKLVHSLGLKICVEGVETEEELNYIRALGPDYIQGFFYGRPCPEEEFIETFCK